MHVLLAVLREERHAREQRERREERAAYSHPAFRNLA
jgi:hypothetical protein